MGRLEVGGGGGGGAGVAGYIPLVKAGRVGEHVEAWLLKSSVNPCQA